MARNARKKAPLKVRRMRKRVLVGVLTGMFAVALVSGTVYGLHRPEVRIDTVTVTGVTYTRADLVERLVRDHLAGMQLLALPNNSTLLYPRRAILRDIHKQFHTVNTVEVLQDDLQSITVSVSDRVPAAYWCSATSECFFMDEGGYIFLEQDKKGLPLVTYTGGSVESPLGAVYLNGQLLSLMSFVHEVEEVTNRAIAHVLVDEHSDVSTFFEEGGEVRFVLSERGVVLLDNIASVFAAPRFSGSDVLEYADFRFGNNVYVKFVEDEE